VAKQEQVTVERGNDDYFQLMNHYLLVQAWALNNTLKDCGVGDPQQRERICAQFGLSMGQLFDSEWLRVNGKRYFPLLIFSEKFLTPRRSLDQIGYVLGPDKIDEFHPLAVDAATVLFRDQNETINVQSVGGVELSDQE
jgi:hypothetical protein